MTKNAMFYVTKMNLDFFNELPTNACPKTHIDIFDDNSINA